MRESERRRRRRDAEHIALRGSGALHQEQTGGERGPEGRVATAVPVGAAASAGDAQLERSIDHGIGLPTGNGRGGGQFEGKAIPRGGGEAEERVRELEPVGAEAERGAGGPEGPPRIGIE